ncbi:phage tail sheath subtilisin-like domain-containing protein [Anaerovibrio sp. RM50]|uniref:phage tail sheath subtilisin-like domain-containing protein n=1 Tax=Anaerovibrio sp. RM50 TaxID=1200557 RepID=UPI000485DE2E|nr:phage tail sheath subtilisin-like domain-containing protein [Anaerovibrio sp. RM50]
MSGTFTIGEKKVRPGVYYRYENAGNVSTVGATNGVLAALFQSNWGPLNKQFEMDVTMINNIPDYYGTGEGTEVLKEGFKGGATTIRAVRVGGDDGVAPTIKLTNSSGQNIVQIDGAYAGDRAFTVSVRTNLVTNERQCVIYDGTEIFEQYSFEAGNNEPENLVEAMRLSKNFNAVLLDKTSGYVASPLANITQAPMTGGKNPTVTINSYSKGSDVLERFKWNCIVADTDDSGVQAVLESFVEQSYETGHLGMTCIAGTSYEDMDRRIAKAASINDEKVVYLVHGWVDSEGKKFEGWNAAARIGGMIAAFETNTTITHDVIKNAVELIEPMTNGEMIKAEQRGCLVLSVNDSDQIWIDSAINTLVTPDDNQDEGWKKIRRTKTRFELMDRVDSTCEKLVAKVNNDTDGRQTVMAAAQNVINEMIGEKKIFDGSTIYEDAAHPAEGDSAWFTLAIDDIDSLEKIYMTYRFRFSQNS